MGKPAVLKSEISMARPDWAVLRLEGVFDRDAAPAVRKQCLGLANKMRAPQIEINLSGAKCADSSSLAVILEVYGVVQRRGGQLRLTGIQNGITRMISLSKLDEIFKDVIVG